VQVVNPGILFNWFITAILWVGAGFALWRNACPLGLSHVHGVKCVLCPRPSGEDRVPGSSPLLRYPKKKLQASKRFPGPKKRRRFRVGMVLSETSLFDKSNPGARRAPGSKGPALFIPSFIVEQTGRLGPEAALTSDLRPLISDFRPLTSDFCPYDVEAAGS
jgi:hypothetical protein